MKSFFQTDVFVDFMKHLDGEVYSGLKCRCLIHAVVFRGNFPGVRDYYRALNKQLFQWKSGLEDFIPSPELPFLASTLNLGPQTVCDRHLDAKNLAYGLCLVMALGDFDYRRGGHLVLHEAKVILELRPGSAVFLPSAVISHSNIKICPGETRMSFTAYYAGSIAQFIDNGLCCNSALPKYPLKKRKEDGDLRWQNGWKLYSTAEELGIPTPRASMPPSEAL